MISSPKHKLLEICDLVVDFEDTHSPSHRILDGIALTLQQGDALSLVGESGSGKTVLALTILGLLPETGHVRTGKALWNGVDLLRLNENERRKIRGSQIAMIFQDPQASLNPVHPVGKQIAWLLRLHRDVSRVEATLEALQLFESVKLKDPERCFYSYPRELSGGMCQRVMIAMALACRPKLLIADEPTSALDVTTAAGIVNLIGDLRQSSGLSILFITHDLGLAAKVSQHVAIIDKGVIVDQRPISEVFSTSIHPITRRLLASYEALSPNFFGTDQPNITGANL